MKILMLCTSDMEGGAAIAANRLMAALRKHGHEVRMLVANKKGTDPAVEQPITGKWHWFIYRLRKYADWMVTLPQLRKKREVFLFSMSRFGFSIHQHAWVKWADVVHLHWINHGFLAIEEIGRLNALKKPLIWTLHDQWAFTGGCHYSGVCNNYEQQCGNCRFARFETRRDISHSGWARKANAYAKGPIHFVTCSQWLGGLARNASLSKPHSVTAIPNSIDTTWFKPSEKAQARQLLGIPSGQPLILFGAASLNDPRKGYSQFLEMLGHLRDLLPADKLPTIVFFGNQSPDTPLPQGYNTLQLGPRRNAELVATYAAADLFVTTSQEDNLPNTVMEAMACGTAVAAFAIGGIPEMVQDGATGCLAPLNDNAALAQRIADVLQQENTGEMGVAARQFVENNYSEALVAARYTEVYQAALSSPA